MPEITCEVCGKKRHKSPREFNKTVHHFCSRDCFFEYRIKQKYYNPKPISWMRKLQERISQAESEAKK
jgi:hypothetical protein